MAKISLYLSSELDKDIKLLAKHEGIKINDLVIKALSEYLKNNSEALDFARRQEHEREEFLRLRGLGSN